MKLSLTLGGVAALMLAGVFYTFAFCMVEDVDDGIVAPEYYYIEPEEDIFHGEMVTDGNGQDDRSAGISSETHEDERRDVTEDDFDEEAVPAAVTAVPAGFEEPARETEAVSRNVSYNSEPDEDYPEDYDTDDYDDGNAEAYEQSVYGGDNFKDGTLSRDEQDDIPEETTAPKREEEPAWTEQKPAEKAPEFSGDIIVTLFDESSEKKEQETSVSVTVGNDSGTSTNETFTARFDGAVQTVNAYDLVCWIVNNEISTSFSDEAIKAQAVAAYSYVKYHNVNGLTPSVLVKKNPPQRIKDMVSSVWGVCCYYNGKVAQTVYMASSSGYTADAKNVWGGSVPYLKSVACPFDSASDPNYGVRMTVSESTMRSYLENSLNITLSSRPENWMVITGYVDGNYVASIDIDGQTTISGRKMRENVFGYKLKSAAFDVSYSNGNFIFTTYGYGHGVGMSQNGANILAKQGCSYSEILKYYFTGIEVL